MPLIRREVAGEPVKLFVLPPSDERRAHFGGRWRQFTESDEIFGLDVETTAIDEDQGTFDPDMRLRAVQFGSETQGWMLDPSDPFWRARIVRLLRDQSKRFVSHTNYDVLWVRREFGIDLAAEGRSIDTMPMASLLHPGPRRPKNLKDLSTHYIDAQLAFAADALEQRFKELAQADPSTKGSRVGKKLRAWGFTNIALDDPVFGLYGGFDAVYVRRLLPILAERLRSTGMAPLSRKEQRIERICTGVQVRGHKVDADYTRARLDEVNAAFDAASDRLWQTFGFTPGSPKVGPWLEGHGIKFAQRTPSGRPELSKDTLPYLAELYPESDELRDLLTLSTHKNLRTNLAKLYRGRDADGFVHPRIKTQQAVTGRMSITDPPMQTFKKGPLRGCFVVSAPGNVFVGADYEGQEIRLAAAFSEDELLNRIVAEGLSQHVLTAESIFGERFLGKDESPNEYKAAKILDFAQQYGAGPEAIAAQLGISVDEAKVLWAAWNKAYRGLVKWTRKLSKYNSVTNPWGRLIPADRFRRYANGNYAIQSSGRDALGDAIVNLADRGLGDAIWLPVHDEIVLEVREDDAERCARVLEECMYVEVGPIELTAKAEIIGTRWSGEK